LRLGHLQNLETRRGAPARIIPGEPLPEDKAALPTVGELYRCLDLPETDATVQPWPSAHIYGKSWVTVAQSVAQPMQPSLQPLGSGLPDTKSTPSGDTVAGLQSDWRDEDTHTRQHPSPLVRAAIEIGAVLATSEAEDDDGDDAEMDALAREREARR
ncbi:MAG: hypothetical protein ABR978_07495, partial [Dehalococcoidia bacterium]